MFFFLGGVAADISEFLLKSEGTWRCYRGNSREETIKPDIIGELLCLEQLLGQDGPSAGAQKCVTELYNIVSTPHTTSFPALFGGDRASSSSSD